MFLPMLALKSGGVLRPRVFLGGHIRRGFFIWKRVECNNLIGQILTVRNEIFVYEMIADFADVRCFFPLAFFD